MTLPSTIRERLERCTSLPTVPAVAIRVLELCQQEQLDLRQIAEAISNDPALSVKLMRTANSPIFAPRSEVTSIPFAVSLLGINAIRTLVLSFSLSTAFQAGKRAGLRDYWRRSLLSALAARQVCRYLDLGLQEEAFLSGLLQDIGMLALAQAAGQSYLKLIESAKRDHERLVELERATFECSHAQVGAWLLSRWRLPQALTQVVGASHEPPAAKEGERRRERLLACIVALSGHFADQWAGDPKKAAAKLCAEVERFRAAGFEVDVEAVNAALIEQGPELGPMFDVKLDAAEMSATLDQAQDVLLALSVRTSQELSGIHQALARLESRTAALLADAQKDGLTGVANRGYTTAYLSEVFHSAVETKRLVGAIFADVDRFKRVNDDFGHSAGDSVLQSIAETIAHSVRGGDFVGRWGGEEFVIVMRAESLNDLSAVAERIRRNVAERQHPVGGGRSLPVTISLGCALLDSARHKKPSDLIDEADRALYEAKRAGRNQFRLFSAA